MKKLLLFLLFIPVVLILGIVLYLGYLGFIPGLSTIMKTDRPRDLGISYTEADFTKYNEKVGATVKPLDETKNPGKNFVFSEPKELDVTLTAEECSARLNYAKWKYMPVTNLQVKFNDDSSLEVSGNLIVENIPQLLSASGYKISNEQLNNLIGKIDGLPINPTFYAKAKPQVANNKATVAIESLEVGKLSIDPNKYDGNELATELVNQIFTTVDGFEAESITFSNQGMKFKGQAPTIIESLSN